VAAVIAPEIDVRRLVSDDLFEVVVGDEVPITRVVVADPTWQPAPRAGDVVLLLGCAADDAAVDGLLHQAGRAGVAAVVVRSATPVLPSVAAAARAAGVALVRVRGGLSWDDVHDLLDPGGRALPAAVRRRAADGAARARAAAEVRDVFDRAHAAYAASARPNGTGAGAAAGVVSVAAFAVADGRTAVPGPVAELIGLRAAGLDDDRARWAALGPIFYVVSGAGDELVRLAEAAVADAARVFDVSVRAGIGRSRAEADGALRCARGVTHIDDVRAQVVLAALRPLADDVRHPHADRLDRLRALDARRDTGYIDTLLAWFDTGGSVSAAAARVHVHVNTFRYRLRRIAAVSGINLDDPDERLALELQLRLSRQSRPGSH
jgi:hypothetical protein